MAETEILRDVANYYSGKLQANGPGAVGMDWRDEASQFNRFDQLLRLIEPRDGSVVDFGCGAGALLPYARARGYTGAYLGIDIAPDMIAVAATQHGGMPHARFEIGARPTAPADFAVASGIFNVRLGHDPAAWDAYMEETVAELDRAGRRGFAFNCLTAYSDADRMRPDLNYADPCHWFDLCKRRYSRQVALLHDYGLWEFTLIVRKPEPVS